jgi:hypothetical protein
MAASEAPARRSRRAPLRRTLAQWYCEIAGWVLLAIGVLGFIADAGFTAGSHGGELVVFQVNGWHNLVHIASGLMLLAAARTRPTAKLIAMACGVAYVVFTIWGLTGGAVFGLFPTNGADDIFHAVVAVAGIVMGHLSPATARGQRRRHEERALRARRTEAADPAPRQPEAAAGEDFTWIDSPRRRG